MKIVSLCRLSRRLAWVPVVLSGCLLIHLSTEVHALELEPGIYRNAPIGTNALALAYAYSTGNILTDDSAVPIENAKAHMHYAVVAYSRYLNLFGIAARADAAAPIAWAHFQGDLNGQPLTRDPHGLADPKFRFTAFLLGAPALDRDQFKDYQQRTILALSLMLSAPFGQYDSGRLINLGTNRWGFRPETGLSSVWNRWTVEAAVGAWVYTPNHDYFHGNELTQAPVGYLKGDFIYSFARPVWLSFNYGFAGGGRTSVNGTEAADYQHALQLGGTLSVAVSRQDVIRLNYNQGFVTHTGPEFKSVVVAFSHQWGK